MMGQKPNSTQPWNPKGIKSTPIITQPRNNMGPENIPGSGFKKPTGSPFDGLVKPKPKLKPPKGAQQFVSDVARQEGRYVPAADQSRPGKPNTSKPNRY